MTNQPSKNPRPRVLSGMRPTGRLHLGNYVGALQNWVKLQHTHKCFFFVADWHALTTDYDDTSRIADNTLEVFLDWLGAGLDPALCTMFVQSHVKQHAELDVLFSMITPLSWLERVPTYKEQQQNLANKDLSTYGFLGYPLLQAADILIYQADFVPVGEDQVAHVELTREVARRFNQVFSRDHIAGGKALLKEPQALLTKTPKLLGMDGRKMSKSYGNSILLSEEPEQLAQKINNSVTDRPKLTDKGVPSRCPVGNLHQIFSESDRLAFITAGCTQATIKCVECKALAVQSTEAHLKPIRERRQRFVTQPDLVRKIVQEGGEQAFAAAEETMRTARDAMGLLTMNLTSSSTKNPLSAKNQETLKVGPVVRVPQLPLSDLEGKNSEEKGILRREVWLDAVRKTYPLRDVGHRTYVTRKNRRVVVATSGPYESNQWHFRIGDRHYDAVVLVCHTEQGDLLDFIIPRSKIGIWASFRSTGKVLEFNVRSENSHIQLESKSGEQQDISQYRGSYSFLE